MTKTNICEMPIHDPDQTARALLKMQSAYGFRSQAEMLEYFGGDVQAMIRVAEHNTE